MNISIFHFSQMSLTRRAYYTWRNGCFIIARRSKYHVYYLYELEGFYAEIGYTSSLGKIEFIDAFQDVERLKPYLDTIGLDQLLTN